MHHIHSFLQREEAAHLTSDDKDSEAAAAAEPSGGVERQLASVSGIMSCSSFDSLDLTPNTQKVRDAHPRIEEKLVNG